MSHRLRLLVLAAALCAAQGAHAYTVLGGGLDCADVVREDADENFRLANKWWLLGYFSARNYEGDREVDDHADGDVIYDQALTFCRGNAGSDWDDAAKSVYDSMNN